MSSSVQFSLNTLVRTGYLAVLPMLVGALVVHLMLDDWLWPHELFHTFVEGAGGVMAFALAFVLGVMIEKGAVAHRYVWLSASLVAMGALDIAHALVPPGQQFVWLHSLATFVGGLFAAGICLPARYSQGLRVWHLVSLSLFLSAVLGFWTFFYAHAVPLMLNDVGQFTRMANLLNIGGGIGFVAAWAYFAQRYYKHRETASYYFSNQLLFFGLAALLFQLSALWDGNWWLWHGLKAAAYVLLAYYFFDQLRRDNVALEQTNERITAKMQLAEATIDGARDSVFWIVPDTGIITYTNKEACGSLGYQSDELVGCHVSQIDVNITPEIWDKFIAESDTRERKVFNTVFRRKDGSEFPVGVSAALVQHKGEEHYIALSRDITKQLKTQEELRKAKEEAEAGAQVKSEFLANMSHEIRTPMNAILGMTHLALHTELDARQKNYLDKVHRSADSLLGIINDILDISKIESGEFTMEDIDFDLAAVLDDVTTIIGLKAAEKSLELLVDLAADVPDTLRGDPLRLTQILVNLGSNAIKFTDSGEIRIAILNEGTVDGRIRLKVSVSDTGIGIAPEQQDQLFQQFAQADSSTSRRYGGSGLGLAICRELVEMMDGEIGVSSAVGEGSTFFFTAEFGRVSAGKVNEIDAAVLLPNSRVLIVDDNASAREIHTEMLGSLGLDCEDASSGGEAIQALEVAVDAGKPYGIVLMDWKMPGLDGVSTAAHILKQWGEEAPKIVMVSAYDTVELKDEMRSQQIDCSTVLTKPLMPSTVFNAIVSTFEVTEHLQSADHTKKKSYEDALERLWGARLLLVEDNQINQELASELLQTNGILVDVAENGEEALSMLTSNQAYDGVLMDCQMPVMDGYTATREIRKIPELKALPIIAMTANVMQGEWEKVIACGMNDHIGKPVVVAQLFNTLAKWVKPSATPLAKVSDTITGRLDSLKLLLEQGDAAATDVLAQIKTDADAELTVKLEPVLEAVNDFDFDSALEQLGSLLDSNTASSRQSSG